ncbi:MAG: type II secretion system F family protein [Ilumatobacteraceae bacterium]
MSVGVAVVAGACAGVGALTLLAGLRGVRPAMVVAMRSSRRPKRDEAALSEGLAVWIEQLRDTLAGARGLEQALVVTAETAPDVIRDAVARFSSRLSFTSFASAARQFADEVDHPTCDFVTAALIVAAEQQVRDMGALLDQLASSCRDDVAMQRRIWVSRARTRSAVRIISLVIVLFVVMLFVFNRSYLSPYGSPEGAVVMTLIVLLFGVSLVGMQKLSRIDVAPRFVRSEGVRP